MTDEGRRVPIKVKVVDRRKSQHESDSEVGGLIEEGSDASSAASSAPFTQTVSKGSLREEATSSRSDDASDPQYSGPSLDDDESSSVAAGFAPQPPSPPAAVVEEGGEGGRDYLDDLRRLQAEFDNFRKRNFREMQVAEARGKRRIVEHLLPVLDNFELAIAHGEGGAGVELVFKELKSALEREGLSEIPALGKAFDPQVHEAVESVEDDTVDEAVVSAVYRPGYTFGEDVVRPAMVVVARPSERVAEGGA
jgi:molecular chaperone GrpE